jgi:hypothetical protein
VNRISFKDTNLCKDRIEREEELKKKKIELNKKTNKSKENIKNITETDQILRKKEISSSSSVNILIRPRRKAYEIECKNCCYSNTEKKGMMLIIFGIIQSGV